MAALGTGSCVSGCLVRPGWVLGAGQNTKERLSCSPRAEQRRGVTGEEVLGSNNFIKNGMSVLFEGERGSSNHDGNVSAGKGSVWSVAMGQVEYSQGMATKPNTDQILVSAHSSWLLFLMNVIKIVGFLVFLTCVV